MIAQQVLSTGSTLTYAPQQPTLVKSLDVPPENSSTTASPVLSPKKVSVAKNGSPHPSTKTKKESPDCPIFLRKTYHMIGGCDPSIATWSDDGETFVVKDTEKFASEIIPQFFKHNNFSSFVRQLNFYGFRKIKTDPIKINTAIDDVESKYWRFRHEKFQKGRPDLLIEIKKANHNASPDQQEVDALKTEVSELKSKVATMSSEIEHLTTLVKVMMSKTGTPPQLQNLEDASASKKRKIIPDAIPSSIPGATPEIAPTSTPMPFHVPSALPDPATASDSDLLMEDPSANGDLPYIPGSVTPLEPIGRLQSIESLSGLDEDLIADVFGDLDPNVLNVDVTTSSSVPATPDSTTSDDAVIQDTVRPEIVNKMKNSLAALPPKMQDVFVERLLSSVLNPACFNTHVEAVSALANAAATEAQKHLPGSKISVPVAAATLGAFLTQYDAQMKGHSCLSHSTPMVRPTDKSETLL